MRINNHYLQRYYKFIDLIRKKGERNLDYKEIHRILPKCLGGTNDSNNLIELSCREHFIAHWMLFNSYNDIKIKSAFIAMCHKNPKIELRKKELKFEKGITSHIYERKKKQFYDLMAELNSGWVTVYDIETNEKFRIECKDFDKQRYYHKSLGKGTGPKLKRQNRYTCFDIILNKFVCISVDEYRFNKFRYKQIESEFKFLDLETNSIIKIKKSEAKKVNKQKYRYKQIVNIKVSCFDDNGDSISIPLELYNSCEYNHVLKDTFVVFDSILQKNRQIHKEEYNPEIHTTSTKNKVLVKDLTGKSKLISKKEFDNSSYVGHTKGFTTVFNLKTEKYETIPVEEFKNNKVMYRGPASGKVNVIEIKSGKRMQIEKNRADKDEYVNLGIKSQYFKAKEKETGKIKNISIFEWNKLIFDEEYEILDMKKFMEVVLKWTHKLC